MGPTGSGCGVSSSLRSWLAVSLALAAGACSSPTAPGDVSETVALEDGSLLVWGDGGRLSEWREPIEEGVRRSLEVAAPLRVDHVRIEVEAGLQYSIPEIGFGGRADPGRVRLSFDPASPALPRSLETELVPLLAHELHHDSRLRRVGYAQNLLEAMVLEGLADHFSIQVARPDPPMWARALTMPEVEELLARARPVWLRPGYDHDAWFFGTTREIPRWAGYSLGFEIVRRYLEANPGRLPSDLIGEPASSFADAGS